MKYLLIFGCCLLIAITWLLWIPYMLTWFAISGRFMHEYELFSYPYYWLYDLTAKRNEFGRTKSEQEFHEWKESLNEALDKLKEIRNKQGRTKDEQEFHDWMEDNPR